MEVNRIAAAADSTDACENPKPLPLLLGHLHLPPLPLLLLALLPLRLHLTEHGVCQPHIPLLQEHRQGLIGRHLLWGGAVAGVQARVSTMLQQDLGRHKVTGKCSPAERKNTKQSGKSVYIITTFETLRQDVLIKIMIENLSLCC